MPKALPKTGLPLSGLFAIAKPSGPTSMAVLTRVKELVGGSRLFVDADVLESMKEGGKEGKEGEGRRRGRGGKRGREAVKIGQGGTLDPLADGVLVIGVGRGTKKLGEFLDCVKEYETTCLLGCETDSYDSEGARVRLAPWRHVTREQVEKALEGFRGEIVQTPPIFSALKMDGMPLYEYARRGIPLPRPIEQRKVTVHSLELVEWKGSAHVFRWPEKRISEEEKAAMEKALAGVDGSAPVGDGAEEGEEEGVASAFVLRMKVSGGTYVRSMVHDVARAVGSGGHVVRLTRTRQSRYALEPGEAGEVGCVSWEVFGKSEGESDADGWMEWERAVMGQLEIVDGKKG